MSLVTMGLVVVHNGSETQSDNGSGTRRDSSYHVVSQTSGTGRTRGVWDTIGLGHNALGMQWDWHTVSPLCSTKGLGHKGTGTL